MEEKTTFGKYILEKRKKAGLSQKNLAEALYMTESAVSKWERGISYPDITLVAPLCEILDVSEHELITASDDHRQREIEQQSRSYLRLRKTYSVITYSIYAVSLTACLIADIADGHGLSWFFLVLTSLMLTFSLINVPVIAKNRKGIWTLACSYISLQLLMTAGCLYSRSSWYPVAFMGTTLAFSCIFLPIILRSIQLPAKLRNTKMIICMCADSILLILLVTATGMSKPASVTEMLTVTLYSMILPWTIALVVRYLKLNGFFKTAVCSAAAGLYMFLSDSIINMIIDKTPFVLSPADLSDWSQANYNGNIQLIFLIVGLTSAVVFAAGGIIRSFRK